MLTVAKVEQMFGLFQIWVIWRAIVLQLYGVNILFDSYFQDVLVTWNQLNHTEPQWPKIQSNRRN